MTAKKVCKNEGLARRKNDIRFFDKREFLIESFWGRFLLGNSDKESNHHVGKSTSIAWRSL